MTSGFLKWLLQHHAMTALVIVLMALLGVISIFATQPIIDAFSLSDNDGLLVQLGCFLILLVACGWAYDKFKEWQLLRKKD